MNTAVIKRDGRVVPFDAERITQAIYKAMKAVGNGTYEDAQAVSLQVQKRLAQDFTAVGKVHVEQIQDIVEEELMKAHKTDVAKAYILYRKQRSDARNLSTLANDLIHSLVDSYLDHSDWRVKENSNMTYSLQGLNNRVISEITSEYWLTKIYPEKIAEAHRSGDFHLHDLGLLAPYCCGWSLEDLLLVGFCGVSSKVESAPPKHFRTALGQIVNFFYTLQGEAAGAQAFSSFDTYLAPFVAYDGLTYDEVKQALQEFVFNLNVPTRVGFQTPFVNLTLDIICPSTLADQAVIIGGQYQDRTYKEFQREMDMINLAFCEVMMEGDSKGRIFSFPIPTYNISKGFNWDNPVFDKIMEMTAKYGIPYFTNFINSDLNPEDARSMCCRLRLDTRELRKRGGGLFGSNPLTGSIGVVTINMPRIAYLAKGDKKFFKKRLRELMDLAKESLIIKRKTIEQFTEQGLYPYSRYYLRDIKARTGQYWHNHFNTIGLVGMNEACLELFGENIASPTGRAFAEEILNYMRSVLVEYQEETGQMFNLEATPAEGTSYRLAMLDKKKYPDIITAGKDAPYYTNSTQLPVGYTDDIFEAIELQDTLQTLYTGGTVLHGFLGERIEDVQTAKALVRKVMENYRIPYFTITPTFSVCRDHGYIAGEHFTCPTCGQEAEVWSRVVGFYRPVQAWNKGKQAEFKDRLEYRIS
jgi:anaerobic ribonucleoside-triphosphate reductase